MADPKKFTEAERQRIINALTERGATRPCSRCGNPRFALLDGYFSELLGDGLNFNFGGPVVPSVVLACEKCGYIVQHALGVLGLLDMVRGVE